jgi:Family of unknown function (DUF5677)
VGTCNPSGKDDAVSETTTDTLEREPGWVRPSNEKTEVAARDLIALVEARLPQRFYGGESYWRFYCAAMIMRMADTVEAMLALMHADYPVDGLVLLRALYEEVVGYLWIASNSDTNLLLWIEGACAWELKMHNDAANYGMEILSPDEVQACQGARMIPDLAQRAAEVDKHWGGRLIGFRPAMNGQEGILTFRGLYVAIYRFASRAAHGHPSSLSPYADAEVDPARVSRSEPAPTSIWWPLAVPLFAHALIVCSDHVGWPEADRVRAINDAMYIRG